MQSQPPAIEMAGLTKQFGPHRAVDSLDLAILQGSIFGFLCCAFGRNTSRRWKR